MGRRRFCGDPRIRTTFAFPKQDITILHSFLKTVYEGDDHAPSVIVMPSKMPRVTHFFAFFSNEPTAPKCERLFSSTSTQRRLLKRAPRAQCARTLYKRTRIDRREKRTRAGVLRVRSTEKPAQPHHQPALMHEPFKQAMDQ